MRSAAVVLVTTPTDIPQVRSNCRQWLKALGGRGGAADLTSHYNNLDAALTGLWGSSWIDLEVKTIYH